MKPGDLVRLIQEPGVFKANPGIDPCSVGLITEVKEKEDIEDFDSPFQTVWVQWSGNSDWDLTLTDDLELVSETG